ncbi:eukaryotic translation initiation factor 4 gamma 3-like [Thunnus maccoyii]|uniref:eukaryotic translation initiation factor 4 gamma 3-like n=1 Tax=Thunnus maccoyii TaxID=8240 RepID=UPI001C4AFFC0|nr:eukaryotic translation initiation factor 4 gamma 3-like [Thunnus maccoyii]
MAANESPSEVDCSCPVCCDIFKDPIVLLCGHSFCKHCLQEWWRQSKVQTCPVCKEIFSMAQPPPNLALRNLSDTLRQERSQRATTGSKEFCSLHSEKLKLFCQDDQELICVICRDAKKHKKHNCVPINEAAQDHRTKLKVQLMHLKSKQGSFEAEKLKCDKMASHITLQAQQTEEAIKGEFQKLYQFLRAEEAARIDAVRKEATLKSEAMRIRIVNLTAESSSLSDKIKTMEQEMKEEDISLMLNAKSSMERSQCNLPEPETPSGALIDEAKHLENLQFTVWRKMRNIIQYTPVKLNKSENAWKPVIMREPSPEDREVQKTQELFRKVRSILDKLMPQNFSQLMTQMRDLTINTEERLKGVVDLVFEKAISEPSFSVVYANMCRCLMGLKVPNTDQPGTYVHFRKLLLNRCQKEFEVMFERKQKELDSAALSTEHKQLQEELEEAKDEAQRRSIGNIKFIGELFKLKMLTVPIMHDSVVKLLKDQHEESLECLCTLLTTVGKDLDHEKAKPRTDQYFNLMKKTVKEKNMSPQIQSMVQDVIDLRSHNWVSKGANQGPKTIKKTHKEVKIEEQRQQRKVCQQLLSKNSKRCPVKPGPMVQTWRRPALSEEEIERKSNSIIDEFLLINDYKEAIQSVDELNLGSQLHIFVRIGVESTLERSQITRDHMGQLLLQLVQQRILPKPQFYEGFADTLEQVSDMAIDIPHIWLYLAELLSPVLREGGFSMRELFSELSKPLIPVGKAGILISEVLHILCKQMNDRTMVGSLWRESGLNWIDFLPEGEDVQAFISQQKLQFIPSDSSGPETTLSKRILSPEELSRQLERLLLEDMASDKQIFDWVEANLDESQMSSSPFLRTLMTAVCKGAVEDYNTNFRVDTAVIQRRLPVLKKYLKSDTEQQLQALYALQALIVSLNQPPNLLRMFFDCLFDEDVISEDAFYKWEMSKDPAEQQGKDVALKSVRAFFVWLLVAAEESEDD